MSGRGNPKINFRVPNEFLRKLDERVEELGLEEGVGGRISGRSLLLRTILADYLGIELPEDPHVVLSRKLKGKPNLFHPSKKRSQKSLPSRSL